MYSKNDQQPAPVGVVPRGEAQAITPLMSDIPETCTVAADLEPGGERLSLQAPQWLTGAAAFGLVAAAVEWLKLTR